MTKWSEASRGFGGEVEVFPLTSVLQILEMGQKSGLLYVRDYPKVAFLVLRSGAIVQAVSSLRRSGLGELLLGEGLIRQEDLSTVLAMQRRSPNKQMLGRMFVELGYVTQPQVIELLTNQMKEIVMWVLRWKKGHFTFYAEKQAETDWASEEEQEMVLPVGIVVQEVLQDLLDDSDRRKHPRVPVSFKVIHRLPQETRTYYTRDVSGGGMYVLSQQFPQAGETLELELWIPTLLEPTPVQCKVIRVFDTVENGGQGFAVQFEKIDGQAREVLEHLGKALGNLL